MGFKIRFSSIYKYYLLIGDRNSEQRLAPLDTNTELFFVSSYIRLRPVESEFQTVDSLLISSDQIDDIFLEFIRHKFNISSDVEFLSEETYISLVCSHWVENDDHTTLQRSILYDFLGDDIETREVLIKIPYTKYVKPNFRSCILELCDQVNWFNEVCATTTTSLSFLNNLKSCDQVHGFYFFIKTVEVQGLFRNLTVYDFVIRSSRARYLNSLITDQSRLVNLPTPVSRAEINTHVPELSVLATDVNNMAMVVAIDKPLYFPVETYFDNGPTPLDVPPLPFPEGSHTPKSVPDIVHILDLFQTYLFNKAANACWEVFKIIVNIFW
jgi:hypothetical protein